MKLRITYLIPAVLIATSIIGAALVFVNHQAVEEFEVRDRASSRINLDLSRLQNILHNLVTQGHLADARLNMSVMAMDAAVRTLLLVDDEHNILISNRYSQENEQAKDYSNYENSNARIVAQSNRPKIDFIGDKREVLVGYYPVVIDVEMKHVGILYMEYSMKNALYEKRQELKKEAVFYSLVLLVSAVIVTILLHLLVSRRLSTLTKAAKNLGQGEFNQSVKFIGDDEISNLSLVFEEMRLRIRDFIKAKEESEYNLRALNESLEERIEERTKSLAEAQRIAKVGSWHWTIHTGELTWSDETFRIFGYEKGEVDVTLDNFLTLIHPDDVARVNEAIETALSTDEDYSVDHRIVLNDGSVKWLHEEGYIEHGAQDIDTVMHGIAQDITVHKDEQVKREALEMQLIQSQKMESIGQLTGGIAHDFNNILASILGFTGLAKNVAKNYHDEKLQSYLDQIDDAGERAASLVSQMLTFSRVKDDIHDLENIAVISLVNQSAKMLKPLIPSSIEFDVLNNVGDAAVNVNPLMIEQVLVNLCINARDAIENEIGKINLSINRVSADNILCSSCGQSASGRFISISVADTGTGINKNVLGRVFDPFYTTKEVGKGTGMGLSIAHGIIHKHDGHIVIASQQGRGVEFRILLPEFECKTSQVDKITVPYVTSKGGNKRTVLVVDDEESILIYLRDLLELEGYNVITKANGRIAEEYFFDNANSIDVVITDQTMPGMNGDELIASILSVKQELPTILCSGYSEKIDHDKAMSIGAKLFMKKPINTSELLSRLEIIFSTL